MESKNNFDYKKRKSQSVNNLNDINNYNINNSQNIIISTYGITSEQAKMIETFAMFQKFMNFSPKLINKLILNNNNFQSNDIRDALNNNNFDKNDNKYYDNYNSKNKERKLNPIKRIKNKVFEKNNMNNINNIETQDISNGINYITTKYRFRYHNKNFVKEEQKLNYDKNNINEDIDNYKEKEHNILKYNNNLIDTDEISIKSNNSLIEFCHEKLNDKININLSLTNNYNSLQNIDDIAIKPSTSSFMELLEKNLKNEEHKYQNKNKKALTTINKNNEKFHHQRPINNLQNNQLHLDMNEQTMGKILKLEKIKLYREKAKEIKKKIYLNSTANINTKNRKNEINNKNNFNSISNNEDSKSNEKITSKINSYSSNLPIRIKSKIKNKCSNSEFDTSEDKDDKMGDKSKALQYQSKTISNTKKKVVSLIKNRNLFQNKTNIDNNNLNHKISYNKITEKKIKLNYKNKDIKEREIYSKKLKLYNKELSKLNKEKEKIKKLKDDYDYFRTYLKNEKAIYDMQIKEEKIHFNNFIVKEIKLINKEKNQLKVEKKYLNDLKVKTKMNNKSENIKGKIEIENMKIKFSEMQKEVNLKENDDKILIEKFKNQLFETNRKIEEMTNLINNLKLNNDFKSVCENNNFIKENPNKNLK